MDSLRRSLPEDSIEYSIYAFPQKSKAGSGVPKIIRQILEETKLAAQKLIEVYLKGYLWHREPFKLETKFGGAEVDCLQGCTNFGESIEDEWLIVWLLKSLSVQIPQIWIRVTDGMGEFLLVEAANVLPSWITPENSDHRVWINKGELRLIPAESSQRDKTSFNATPAPLSAEDAKMYIYDEKPTLHPQFVEEEAFHRLQSYPEQIRQNQHYAILIIPRKLAFLLHENPSYICAAVDSFYLRDVIAMKPLMIPNHNSLIIQPVDHVTMRVQFTRVGFAQLKSQQFDQPPAWQTAEKAYEDARHRERAELGMRICCGFEMLLSDPQKQDDRMVREIKLILEDLETGDAVLQNDGEILSWGMEGDDESWLDIDFDEFEKELSGKTDKGPQGAKKGFGDKKTYDNLHRIVERFEEFMKDDMMDENDPECDDSESERSNSDERESETESTGGQYKEDEFTNMMRELMGMPENVMKEMLTSSLPSEEQEHFIEDAQGDRTSFTTHKGKSKEKNEDEDLENIQRLSASMEAELRSLGALNLSNPREGKFNDHPQRRTREFEDVENNEKSDEDEEKFPNDDYGLIANILESFKGQAGDAGPTSNLMGLLGLKLPRDEGNHEDEFGNLDMPKDEAI